jgi:hypothetical protein
VIRFRFEPGGFDIGKGDSAPHEVKLSDWH